MSILKQKVKGAAKPLSVAVVTKDKAPELTEEHVVATLNGKPVYERTIQYTTTSAGSDTAQVFDSLSGDTLLNVDVMLSMSGSVGYTNDGMLEQWLPVTFVNRPYVDPKDTEIVDRGNYFAVYFRVSSGTLRALFKGISYVKGTPVNMTYRYTKTTD